MLNKKGELTTQQIVILVVLILSFAVILFFLFRLNLGQESEKEVCHNSVVTRGLAVVPTESVPFNCQRQYICLTEDGSCEGLVKPDIEKVKTKEEVYSVLANEMADCWWQFGEGKVDYIGKDFFLRDNYCSICSQIAFDDSIKEIQGLEDGKISKDGLYNYLFTEDISEGETYAEYIYGTSGDFITLRNDILESQNNTEGTGTFGEIEIEKNYFNIMGITSEVSGRGWKIAAATGTAVVGLFIPGIGWTVTGAIVGALIVTGGEVASGYTPEIAGIIVQGDGIENSFLAPTIIEANSEEFKALNCYDITTIA